MKQMTDSKKVRPRRHRARKDRVLQARIPSQLDEELRDRAEHLGLSVSTVVRNVLLHTFDLVEGVVTDSAQIARALQGKQTPSLPPPAEGVNSPAQETAVIGWQEVTLNKNGLCEQCNAILPRGSRAGMGLPAHHRSPLLCPECLANLAATEPGATD
jgi:hypothetical protein